MKTQDKSKHAKYTTGNPISRFLVSHFFQSLGSLYSTVKVKKILDVGCGEGMVLHYFNDSYKVDECYAIDFDEKELEDARNNIPFCNISKGSIYEIPFENDFCDLIICSEVLEHLVEPNNAIKELHRVTSKYALLSVPREPIWRILNMVRLKYWNNLGNTPDHRNHWSKSSFKNFVSPYFEIIDLRSPLPWTIVLCKKK